MIVLLFPSRQGVSSDSRDDEGFPVQCVVQSNENVQFHIAFLRSMNFQSVVVPMTLSSQLFDIFGNLFLADVQCEEE
jgi:hypothetical protein